MRGRSFFSLDHCVVDDRSLVRKDAVRVQGSVKEGQQADEFFRWDRPVPRSVIVKYTRQFGSGYGRASHPDDEATARLGGLIDRGVQSFSLVTSTGRFEQRRESP
jgi:hypothetical protein